MKGTSKMKIHYDNNFVCDFPMPERNSKEWNEINEEFMGNYGDDEAVQAFGIDLDQWYDFGELPEGFGHETVQVATEVDEKCDEIISKALNEWIEEKFVYTCCFDDFSRYLAPFTRSMVIELAAFCETLEDNELNFEEAVAIVKHQHRKDIERDCCGIGDLYWLDATGCCDDPENDYCWSKTFGCYVRIKASDDELKEAFDKLYDGYCEYR